MIWLDLELRKDIDDFMTLVYALENNIEIKAISINNPSIKELIVLNKTLHLFTQYEIPLYYSGDVTEYEKEEDIHISLEEYFIKDLTIQTFDALGKVNKISTIPFNELLSDTCFFCGGSLKTLSLLSENFDINTVYIQGGYAGESIVGKENVLKKFRKREKVPSWNMNLDISATEKVLASKNITNYFLISKNICHNSWIELSDIKNKETYFYQFLERYFKNNKYTSKCMHDLVAFISILNKDFIEFKKVDICSDKSSERVKWYALENNNSNKQISISLDMNKFKEIIQG